MGKYARGSSTGAGVRVGTVWRTPLWSGILHPGADTVAHKSRTRITPTIRIIQSRYWDFMTLLSGKRLFYPYMGEQGVFAPTFSGVTRASQETRL